MTMDPELDRLRAEVEDDQDALDARDFVSDEDECSHTPHCRCPDCLAYDESSPL